MNHSQVAHVWANRSKTRSNSNNSFYFEGRTIFSYGTHFPIATHVENAQGERAVLYTTREYSNSTAKHKGHVWNALDYGRGEVPVFHVPLNQNNFRIFEASESATWYTERKPATLEAFFEDYERRAADYLEKASRARTRKDEYTQYAYDLLQEANRFAAFFGLHRSISKERVSAIAEDAKRARAEQAKREREELAKRKAKQAEDFQAWQRGDFMAACPSAYATDENGSAYLVRKQYDGCDYVQTSRGAEVPFEDARRAFRFVKLCRMTGRTFKANGVNVPVGHFAIRSIDIEGNVQIGCHYFTWERVEAFAKASGIFDDAATDEALMVTEGTH